MFVFSGLREAVSEIPKRFPIFFIFKGILGIVGLKQHEQKWNKSVMSFTHLPYKKNYIEQKNLISKTKLRVCKE